MKNIDVVQSHQPDCVDCSMHARNMNDVISYQTDKKERVFQNSNPTVLTLDEFADREMARMAEQEQQQAEFAQNKEDSDSENEEVSERKQKKAREWDDWKDLNEKGAGNKKR